MPRSYRRSNSRDKDYDKGESGSVKSREDSQYHYHHRRHHRDDRDSYECDDYGYYDNDTAYRGGKRSREHASDSHSHEKRASDAFAEHGRSYRQNDEEKSRSYSKYTGDYDRRDKKEAKNNDNSETGKSFRSGLEYADLRRHVGEPIVNETTASSFTHNNGGSSGNTEFAENNTKGENSENFVKIKAMHDNINDDIKTFSDKSEKMNFVEANKEDCITIDENTSAEEIYDRLCVYHDVPLSKNTDNNHEDSINYASNVNFNSKKGAVLLPPGWEKVEYQDSTVYLDHIAREAHEEAPWIVWRRRADKYNFTA